MQGRIEANCTPAPRLRMSVHRVGLHTPKGADAPGQKGPMPPGGPVV